LNENIKLGIRSPSLTFCLVILFALILYLTYYCQDDFCLDFSCFQLGGVEGKKISRIFWYYFAHDGIDHFLENMVVFSLLFYYLEKELNGIISLIVLLFSAIVSGILFLYLDICSDKIPVVGASGGNFGLMGSFLVCGSKGEIHFIPFIKNPRIIMILRIFIKILILLLFLYGIISLLKRTDCRGLAHSVHISGFIVGVILTILYRVMIKYFSISFENK